MSVTAQQVKELREMTGAGMMECKKALVETNGDIEAAVEMMRKAGTAKAAKRAGRVAAEGVVLVLTTADKKQGVIVEVNCETDFVARDENFTNFANRVAELALTHKINEVATLSALTYQDGEAQTIEETRANLVAKIGENITIRRIHFIDAVGMMADYVHGSRIGTLVDITGGDTELHKDITMHIAASSPVVVSADDVSQDKIAKERDIFLAQAENSGKPAEIIEKMVEGRIRKFVQEVSLLGQPFVKDPNTSVADLLKSKSATVNSFTRFELGEGIEKITANFAEEVMEQVRQT